MLPKKNRADTKAVQEIFKKGKSLSSASLNFKFISENKDIPPRISFVVPKNIAKLAVKRNKLRRFGYDALQSQINNFPRGLVGVFIFKKDQNDIPSIENEIKIIFNKIN